MHQDNINPERDPHISAEHQYLGMNKNILYGLQHVLTMYGGIIAPPLIIGAAAGLDASEIGLLVAAALFVGGLATVIQTIGFKYFGAKLPIVQGVSFAGVATILAIVSTGGGVAICIWCCDCRISNWFVDYTILCKNYPLLSTCGHRMRHYHDWYFAHTCCDPLDYGRKPES